MVFLPNQSAIQPIGLHALWEWPVPRVGTKNDHTPLTTEQTMFIDHSTKEMTMTFLLHFVSIFASFALLALALTIIQMMIGTYRDRIISALKGDESNRARPGPRVTLRQRSLLVLPA
jgi:hypothetical protein